MTRSVVAVLAMCCCSGSALAQPFEILIGTDDTSNGFTAGPPMVKGEIDHDALAKTIDRLGLGLTTCYWWELGRDGSATGTAQLEWRVATDGTVTEVTLLPGWPKKAPFTQCLKDVIRHATFPRPAGSATIRCAFTFKPSPIHMSRPAAATARPFPSREPAASLNGPSQDPIEREDPGGEWPAVWSAKELELLKLINQRRALGATCRGVRQAPAPPLELDTRLRTAARGWSQHMRATNVVGHGIGAGSTPGSRMRAAGYEGSATGENVAWSIDVAADALGTWLESHEGHCELLMRPELRHIGIGVVDRFWTADFGAP